MNHDVGIEPWHISIRPTFVEQGNQLVFNSLSSLASTITTLGSACPPDSLLEAA